MQKFASGNCGKQLRFNRVALHQDQRVRSRLARVDGHAMPAQNVDNCVSCYLGRHAF